MQYDDQPARAVVAPSDFTIELNAFVRSSLPTLARKVGSVASWSVSTIVDAGKTPVNWVWVRNVSLTPDQPVAFRHVIDLLVWADGTSATEKQRIDMTRLLYAFIRREFGVRLVSLIPAAPDPADANRRISMLTVEVLRNGQQL